MNSQDKVLIIDDEFALSEAICAFLRNAGYDATSAATASSAMDTLRRNRPDAVVVDYLLPDGNALDLMSRLRTVDPDVPVIILTGHGSIDLAVQAIKIGAEQFLTKPVELGALQLMVARAIENKRNVRKQVAGISRTSREMVDPFVGSSDAICRLREQAERIAPADCSVLILGPTGAGKGVLARWIHEHSARSREALVDLNCAAFARELLETELFGHERGAFTGAINSKVGLFEAAHRGTIFLDEIGDMDPQLQPKLLKVLEEQRFRRVGEVRDRHVDIRLITATHQDLGTLVQEKKFRADLYFRINVVSLRVPSLASRGQDLRGLANAILQRIASELGRSGIAFDESALAKMATYSWPGNIRELRNAIERAVLLCDSEQITARHVHFDDTPDAQNVYTDRLTLDQVEKMHIQNVLAQENGSVMKAAARLGIPRSTLYCKIRAFSLPDPPSASVQ